MDVTETVHYDIRWMHLARGKFREVICRNSDEYSCSLKASNALHVIILKTINFHVVNYSVCFFLDILTFQIVLVIYLDIMGTIIC
jgi:hypothetical protein